jgi:signal transduction histidine kinase
MSLNVENSKVEEASYPRVVGGRTRAATTPPENDNWFWIFQCVFWSFVVILGILMNESKLAFAVKAYIIIITEIFGFALTSALYWFWFRKLGKIRFVLRIAAVIAACTLMLPIYVTLSWATWADIIPVGIQLNLVPEGMTLWQSYKAVMYFSLILNYPILLCWAGFYLSFELAHAIRLKEYQLYQSRLLAKEAQLKMLRFQINPHFLFNTLNAISSLVLTNRNREAEKMLLKLSNLLRLSLVRHANDKVPLIKEIEMIELYLDIERQRFSDRLHIKINFDEAIASTMVPAMILQPIVENSVKHGVSNTSESVAIEITASADGDKLNILIEDDGKGEATTSSKGTGVGLSNVRDRLKGFYGDEAQFFSMPLVGGGYRTTIIIPMD